MAGEGIYDASRTCGRLRIEGFACGFYRVRDFMDKQGLQSIHRKRHKRSLKHSRKARGDGYANLTKDIQIHTPFQVLSSEIRYIQQAKTSTICVRLKTWRAGLSWQRTCLTIWKQSWSSKRFRRLYDAGIPRWAAFFTVIAEVITHQKPWWTC